MIGGTFSLTSTLNAGTEIKVRVPISATPPEEAARPS
jgi:chemotaxis protein histidine kinase CheA